MKCRLGGFRLWGGLGLFLMLSLRLGAADLKEAQQQFLSGNYTGCLAAAELALKGDQDREEWELLRGQTLLELGRYLEARNAITNALEQQRWSVRVCWLARKAFEANGEVEAAHEMTGKIIRMVSQHPSDFRDAASLVVFGQAAVLEGADPKRVLDTVFESARKSDPKLREVYLASGNLALDKHDYALAAKRFEAGLKELPDDPDLQCGLARAYEPSDAPSMVTALEAALSRNSNHVGSLLLLADRAIEAENYDGAKEFLDQILGVNPSQPKAWAYQAVLAHLQNRGDDEKAAREKALKYWPSNPDVDYLIGEVLSQNYRFAEGAAHQRQALQFDPDYLQAKAQLAQDLLRLGNETEGWALAEQVQKADAYDVEAYNLVTLRDTMKKFVAVTNANFLVRMSPHEAAVYGSAALDLLERARSNLCVKYGFEVMRPTMVEIFPEQKDFAVRTFGFPGDPGYLGVCFGTVITANSPTSHTGHPINWEAVLWHEFCHVVTLQLTRNKMPRWLSEGISVYEEKQANLTWGQQMTPRYREMVLGDELTPVSKLSGAFLSPPSAMHLQFAYYEASLVVEFLVQRFGAQQLRDILKDLGDGGEINQVVEKHTMPMTQLESEFAAFARQRAQALAPGLDFTKPDSAEGIGQLAGDLFSEETNTNSAMTNSAAPPRHRRRSLMAEDPAALESWAKTHPTNYYALMELSQRAIDEKRLQDAKAPLEKLLELYPTQTGPDSAYALLAAVLRASGETNAEKKILVRWAELDDEASDADLRLMELDSAAQEWPALALNARRYLAVNPLSAQPYRYLAQASEKLGQDQRAAHAYRALLELDPPDPAEAHFRLAQALHRLGDRGARQQVLEALEEAPRYQAALRLLLELNGEGPQAKAAAGTVQTANP